MRKVLTGATQQAHGTDAAGNVWSIGSSYAVATPQPQLPPSGILDIHRELDYGLSLSKATDTDGPDNSVHRDAPNPVKVTYVPLVSQNIKSTQNAEHYRWQETLDGITASADLPRTITIQYPAWTIENLTATYGLPLLLSEISYNAEKSRTYVPQDAIHSDTVSLHYDWNDGVSGDASVTTHLHQAPLDNYVFLGAAPPVAAPNEPYVQMYFEHGTEANLGSGDNYWSTVGNLYPTSVVVQPAGVNFIQMESAAAWGFALSEFFVPEAAVAYVGFASATLGEATNFTAPPAPTTQLWDYTSANGTTFANRDAAIAYWNTVWGRVTPSNYEELMPIHDPSDSYANYVRWHVEGQPRTQINYYLADKWGVDGYEGQAVTSTVPDCRTVFKGSPLNGFLHYNFDFPTLTAAGPSTGDPPSPVPGPMPGPHGGGGQ